MSVSSLLDKLNYECKNGYDIERDYHSVFYDGTLFDDIDNIMLEVNEKNLAAISLYKKNKFKIISKRKNYYGKDTALIMKRDVDNGRC